MKIFNIKFILFILFFVYVICEGNKDVNHDKALEDVVKQILKINPPENGKLKDEQPPKHMLELYHRFISGRRASGETVRSITPFVDIPHHHLKDIILFNVSHINSDEEIRLGQLLLHRRRQSRHPHTPHRSKLLAPPYRVRLYQVVGWRGARPRALPLASIPVPQVSRGGWHSLDITSALRELLVSPTDSSGHLTLGVRFEAPRSKILNPYHFLNNKDNTSAFLMVFTDETSDNELHHNNKKSHISPEHLQILADLLTDEGGHPKKRHHLHHTKIAEDDNPRRHKNKNVKIEEEEGGNGDIQELINMDRVKNMKRHHKLYDALNAVNKPLEHKYKSNNFDEWFGDSETRRVIRSIDNTDETKPHKRRSIYDNELPYEKLHIGKEKYKHLTTTTERQELTTEVPEDDDDKNLIPYPPGMRRKRKKKSRRGKKRNQRSKTTKFPDEWHQYNGNRRVYGPNSSINSAEGNHTCSRRHLKVTFKELGWSNWIVAPLYFDVDYCAGSCSLPIPENVPLTNHAVIQGLVHKDIDKDVPEPCCVPHTMSPLTVLYFEDENHVILKNYRSMTVETCGCR